MYIFGISLNFLIGFERLIGMNPLPILNDIVALFITEELEVRIIQKCEMDFTWTIMIRTGVALFPADKLSVFYHIFIEPHLALKYTPRLSPILHKKCLGCCHTGQNGAFNASGTKSVPGQNQGKGFFLQEK